MSATISSAAVSVSVEELEQASDALHRFAKTKLETRYDWYILAAAQAIIHRAAMRAKYGRVPGE